MKAELKNTPEIETALLEHTLKSDKIMLYLIGLHWFIATAITSFQYDTYQMGFINGGLYFLISLFAYTLYRGQKEFRITVGIVFMLFSILYIQQSLGRIEMHFHIFVAISFLTLYKDIYAVVSAAVTTSIHHLLFNYMQEHQMTIFGEPVYIFNYGCGYDIVLLHILFVVFESLVIYYFIEISKNRFFGLVMARKKYADIAETLENTVEKRTEELTQLNSIFEEAQQITHLGNWEWNVADGSLTWSDEIYRIFGLEPQSTLPTYEKFTSFIHPDDRDYVSKSIEKALQDIAPYNVVHRIITPTNESKYVREHGKIHRDKDGKPLRMLGTVQDITGEMNIQLELKKSEDKFKVLTENGYTGVLVHDEHIYYANPQLEQMTGFSHDELLDMHLIELFVIENSDKLRSVLQRRAKGEKFTKQYDDIQMRCKDGSIKTVSAFSMTIEYEGKFVALSNIIDVTDIRKAEEQIQALSQIVEQTDDIIKMTDKEGVVNYVNDAFVAQTGYTRREVIGAKANILKSGKHDKVFYKMLWDTITQGDTFRSVLINRRKNGSLYHEEQTITPILNKENQITGYVSTGKDISERIELENKLSKLATTDKLTGIYNRHRFEELLAKELARAERYNTPMALIMFDIDYFKNINDTYGHDVGDNVLRTVSEVIRFNIRETDIFARWGGEEFIILTPETTEESAEHLAKKLCSALEQYDFETAGTVTASFGVTMHKSKETNGEMIKRADKAMYQAKQNGRNQVVKLVL